MNKKMTGIMLCAAIAASALTGCTGSEPGAAAANNSSGKKLSIVCTIFPEYDWVRQILGNHAANAELTYLLDSGMDLHSYQPTALDMSKIAECDLFVYVGGESDAWTEDALKEAVNKDMQVISLMKVMGDAAKEEEIKEGMQGEDEADEETGEEEEPEYDEHVWLSLRNAKTLCTEIADKLSVLDSANAADYKANLGTYTAQLDKLDGEFKALTDSASQKTLIFGDRFPFRYLTDDYGLDYYAAFVGCSAETEASFETIVFLAEKMDALGCGTIFTIENSDHKIAQTIIDNTKDRNQTIAELNSLQSVTKDQIGSGVTYLSLMQKNYETLKAAIR